jgi:hypothetical protein
LCHAIACSNILDARFSYLFAELNRPNSPWIRRIDDLSVPRSLPQLQRTGVGTFRGIEPHGSGVNDVGTAERCQVMTDTPLSDGETRSGDWARGLVAVWPKLQAALAVVQRFRLIGVQRLACSPGAC